MIEKLFDNNLLKYGINKRELLEMTDFQQTMHMVLYTESAFITPELLNVCSQIDDVMIFNKVLNLITQVRMYEGFLDFHIYNDLVDIQEIEKTIVGIRGIMDVIESIVSKYFNDTGVSDS